MIEVRHAEGVFDMSGTWMYSTRESRPRLLQAALYAISQRMHCKRQLANPRTTTHADSY
jgi:hypothetical protein